jgi:hypothetical protein
VAPLAVCLGSELGSRPTSPKNVDSWCDWFQMLDLVAPTLTTQVIQNQSGWNRTVSLFPGQDVNQTYLAPNSSTAIPTRQSASP